MAPGPFTTEQKGNLKEGSTGRDRWTKEGRGESRRQSEIRVVVNRREDDRAPPRFDKEREARNNIPSLLSLQLDDVGDPGGPRRGRSRFIQRGSSPTGRGKSFNKRGRGRGREQQASGRRDLEVRLERERRQRQQPYHRSPSMARTRGKGFTHREGVIMGPPPPPDKPYDRSSFRGRDGRREGTRVDRGNNSYAENMDGDTTSGFSRNRNNGQGFARPPTSYGSTSRRPGQPREERERKDITLSERNQSEDRGHGYSSESNSSKYRSRSERPSSQIQDEENRDDRSRSSMPGPRGFKPSSDDEGPKWQPKNHDPAEQHLRKCRSPNSTVSDAEEHSNKKNAERSDTDSAAGKVQVKMELGPNPDSSSELVQAQVVPDFDDSIGLPKTEPASPTEGEQEPANSDFVPDHQSISEFYNILDYREKALLRRRLLQGEPTERINGNGYPSTTSMPITLEGLHDEIVVAVIASNPILSAKFFPTLGKIQEESLQSLRNGGKSTTTDSFSQSTFTNEFNQFADFNPDQTFIGNLTMAPPRPENSGLCYNNGFSQARGNRPFESVIYPTSSPLAPNFDTGPAPSASCSKASTSTNTDRRGSFEPNKFGQAGRSYNPVQIGFHFNSSIPSPPSSPTDSEIEVMLNEADEEETEGAGEEEEYFEEDYGFVKVKEEYEEDSAMDTSDKKYEPPKKITQRGIRTIGFGKKYVESMKSKNGKKLRGRSSSPSTQNKNISRDKENGWIKHEPYPEANNMPSQKTYFPQPTTSPRPRVIVKPTSQKVRPPQIQEKSRTTFRIPLKPKDKRPPAKSPERRSVKRKIDFEDSSFPAKGQRAPPPLMKVPPPRIVHTSDNRGPKRSKYSSSENSNANEDEQGWYLPPDIRHQWDYNKKGPKTFLNSGARNRILKNAPIEQARKHKSAKPGLSILNLIQDENERYAARRAAASPSNMSTDTEDEIVPIHVIKDLEKIQFSPIPNFGAMGNLLRGSASASTSGARTSIIPPPPLPPKEFGLLQTSSSLTPEQIQKKHAGIVNLLGLDWTVNAIRNDETDLRKKEDELLSRPPDPKGWSVIHESIQLCRDREKRFLERRRVYEECVDLLGTHLAVTKMVNEEFNYIVNRKQLPDPGDTVLMDIVLTRIKENPGPFKMNLGPMWY